MKLNLHSLVVKPDRMPRWWLYPLTFLLPLLFMGAYSPAALLTFNNLSDLSSVSTARTNLGLGSAAVKTASGASGDLCAGSGSFTVGHIAVFEDSNCSIEDGGAPANGYTVTKYTSNTNTVTLADTNSLVEEIAQGTPAALTITLNATSLSAGFVQCVKDAANTFQTNNATVKTSDGSTIDGVAGTTGYVMNQTHEANCFIYDGAGTNWMVF
jgi:hypothetical protein